MLTFPQSTEFNKRIPKQKFYENISVTPAMKRCFAEQIKMIYWANKIAPTTMNIAPGERVTEVEVFELRLSEPRLDEAVLKLIDREIPYHILFILTCGGKTQAWIGYKEAAFGKGAFKVSRYYHTEWQSEDELHLTVEGLTADDVYENFVRQIAVLQGEKWDEKSSAAENIAQNEAKARLANQIAALESKMRKEKQLNRKMEMNAEIKKLRKELLENE